MDNIENEYVIQMNNITKSFPGIKANNNITLNLKKGEIHALLGENGAGKSTLMSILFGLYQPDEGNIIVRKKVIDETTKEETYIDSVEKIDGPLKANELGIGMVHQHFKLVEVFTVLENIILGKEPTKYGFLTLKKAKKKIQELCEKYEFDLDLDAKIEDITVGAQQKTEILKMLYRDNDILIFDEPTAVLTPQEIDDLLKIMKNLAQEGKSILFISHKLDEIMEVSDRVSILRKGELIATLNTNETNKEELSRLMVGREVSFTTQKQDPVIGETILKVRNLVMPDKIHKGVDIVNNISFNVKEGEIVVIAGIDGNGQSDTIFGITGLEKIKSGNIYFKDKEITRMSIFKRNELGMSHVPEDRHKHGLVLDYELDDNLVLENYYKKEYKHGHFIINKNSIKKHGDELIDKYDIRSGQGSNSIVRGMSGGNQQKAIVGREIDRDPELLILVQPTRGLDIGAIENIHKAIIEQRDEGKAVLVVSYELDEVFDLADRILVMFKGQIVGELNPKTTTREELGLYMAGSKNDYEFKEEE